MIVKIDVKNCARCGGDHSSLEFKPFTRVCLFHTHYAKCPNLGEPLLLKINTIFDTYTIDSGEVQFVEIERV